MRVALAEDGALFREGLLMLLQAAGHEVVGSTADGDALVELLSSRPADVAILDIRMPPEPDGGLLTAERLRAVHPDLGLLFLSHYAESHYLMRILQIGTDAIGYRLKEKALLTFLWVPFYDRPGSGGQRPPRVRSAMAISASGLW